MPRRKPTYCSSLHMLDSSTTRPFVRDSDAQKYGILSKTQSRSSRMASSPKPSILPVSADMMKCLRSGTAEGTASSTLGAVGTAAEVR